MRPTPVTPPVPTAMRLWMTWYPAPWGSDQGLMKLVTRTRRQGTVMTAA